MPDPDRYAMLIASLPAPEALFRARQTPLSRIRLERRLRMLEPADAAALEKVTDVLAWDRLPFSMTDAEIVERGVRTMRALEDETLRDIVRERLEMRTAIAALRRRAAGEPPPAPGEPFGFPPLAERIRARWGDPAFGLERRLPFLPEAARLIEEGDTVALERLILDAAWRALKRREGEHLFDLVAVVVYVLKWNIVDRWVRYDEEAARIRFSEMVAAATQAHGPVAFGGKAHA